VLVDSRVHPEVQELCCPLGIVDPIRKLALHGHRLEVASDFIEHQVRIHAAGRTDHELGVVLEVEKCQSLSLASNSP